MTPWNCPSFSACATFPPPGPGTFCSCWRKNAPGWCSSKVPATSPPCWRTWCGRTRCRRWRCWPTPRRPRCAPSSTPWRPTPRSTRPSGGRRKTGRRAGLWTFPRRFFWPWSGRRSRRGRSPSTPTGSWTGWPGLTATTCSGSGRWSTPPPLEPTGRALPPLGNGCGRPPPGGRPTGRKTWCGRPTCAG